MEKSRFDLFKEEGERRGHNDFSTELRGNGTYDYRDQVEALIQLEKRLNSTMFVYLFGEQLGRHYTEVFMKSRNLLFLLGRMDELALFFILHELKTNKELFIHC